MNILNSSKLPRCNTCGRTLILVGKTETKDTFSKMVVKTYRCPNVECQASIDKKTKARLKLLKEQKLEKKAREKSKMKLNKRKILR